MVQFQRWCAVALLCGTLIAAEAPTTAMPKGPVVVEEIIAKVNGDIVTRGDLEKGRKSLIAEMQQRGGPQGAELERAIREREPDLLRDKVDQLLLIQKGKELSVDVEGQVKKYIADVQIKVKVPDPDEFAAFVRKETGMSFEDYKNDLRNSMLTQRVIGQEVSSKISVPRAEQQKYYEEHKSEFVRDERVFLSEILVSTEGKDAAGVAAAEKKAKALAERARKGEKFPELARDNSDSASAAQGGNLGGWKKGELDTKLDAIVFAQDRGYVTDPLRVANGFLILKVEEKHKAGQAEFGEVESEVMERLYTPRMQPAVRQYLTRLRQEAFLEIKDGYVDSGAAPGKSTRWTDPAQLRPETVTKEELASRPRRKRLLGLVPLPGTAPDGKEATDNQKPVETGVSASKTVNRQ